MVQEGMALAGGLNAPFPEFKLFVMKENVDRALKIFKEKGKPIKEKYKRLNMGGGIIFFLLLCFIPKIVDFILNKF